jgi:hypothetical protein
MRALGVGLLLLLAATTADAKPAGGPICFQDALYGAIWQLDTQDVGGPRHWLVAGSVWLPTLAYPIAVHGSGVTMVTGAAYITLQSTFYGAVGTVGINLGSAAAWWPGANAWFSLFYPHQDHDDGPTYYSLVPAVPLTKVACP